VIKILKNTKDVLKRMEEILSETGPAQDKTAQPNVLERLKAAAGLNRTRNERTE